MKKCGAYNKECDECGKSGHLKRMCGSTNPNVAARFNKEGAKRKLNTTEAQADFNVIADEVDENNEEKIESKDTKNKAVIKY